VDHVLGHRVAVDSDVDCPLDFLFFVGDLVSLPFLQGFIFVEEHKLGSFMLGRGNDRGLACEKCQEDGNLLVLSVGRGKLVVVVGLLEYFVFEGPAFVEFNVVLP